MNEQIDGWFDWDEHVADTMTFKYPALSLETVFIPKYKHIDMVFWKEKLKKINDIIGMP